MPTPPDFRGQLWTPPWPFALQELGYLLRDGTAGGARRRTPAEPGGWIVAAGVAIDLPGWRGFPTLEFYYAGEVAWDKHAILGARGSTTPDRRALTAPMSDGTRVGTRWRWAAPDFESALLRWSRLRATLLATLGTTEHSISGVARLPTEVHGAVIASPWIVLDPEIRQALWDALGMECPVGTMESIAALLERVRASGGAPPAAPVLNEHVQLYAAARNLGVGTKEAADLVTNIQAPRALEQERKRHAKRVDARGGAHMSLPLLEPTALPVMEGVDTLEERATVLQAVLFASASEPDRSKILSKILGNRDPRLTEVGSLASASHLLATLCSDLHVQWLGGLGRAMLEGLTEGSQLRWKPHAPWEEVHGPERRA
jgi:hypothetical protein